MRESTDFSTMMEELDRKALLMFLSAYVGACEKDYILRTPRSRPFGRLLRSRGIFAPVRYRTKLFREVVREVANLVAADERLNMATALAFVKTLSDEVERIKEKARKTLKTCRLAKKVIERRGEAFWRDFTEWNALRIKA